MSLNTTRPIRYLITAGAATPDNFHEQRNLILNTIGNAVDIGIELVQIREKHLTPRLLFELSLAASKLAIDSHTKLLINDRFDIAIAANADGVHLTSTSIPSSVVRNVVPDNFLIGVSCHTKDEVQQARLSGADLAVYGPVFATPGKGLGKGLADLQQVCTAASGFPVLALGGVDSGNLDDVIDAGASGFAAIRYLNDFVNIKQ